MEMENISEKNPIIIAEKEEDGLTKVHKSLMDSFQILISKLKPRITKDEAEEKVVSNCIQIVFVLFH